MRSCYGQTYMDLKWEYCLKCAREKMLAYCFQMIWWHHFNIGQCVQKMYFCLNYRWQLFEAINLRCAVGLKPFQTWQMYIKHSRIDKRLKHSIISVCNFEVWCRIIIFMLKVLFLVFNYTSFVLFMWSSTE